MENGGRRNAALEAEASLRPEMTAVGTMTVGTMTASTMTADMTTVDTMTVDTMTADTTTVGMKAADMAVVAMTIVATMIMLHTTRRAAANTTAPVMAAKNLNSRKKMLSCATYTKTNG